ncbi:hypothetical protein SAMN05216188_13189 [Lentzea xinjiangensis]|jgi:hypothetical protein|uniref:Uncharacterized protein n=1 Tax=Lentzea xinjiangensis TaxID=402600 RepID=A0A1H9W9Y5_9PSEU|nr:hypothetical protein [Lentzea xinjiangensis]SES30589.1 hypothetical protein SAMN05216188_13189 [Lentzea xinjiangensis]
MSTTTETSPQPTTMEELRATIEAQGGVDVKDLSDYAENCWSGC